VFYVHYLCRLVTVCAVGPYVNDLFGILHHVQAAVLKEECPPALAPFSGRPSVYRTGSVTPAVSGVAIVVESEKDGRLVLTTHTDSNGNYKAGIR